MTLGEILKQAAVKDLSGQQKNQLLYTESIKEGRFEIRLSSLVFKNAFVECSIPDKNLEEEKNYLRTYFLSMVYNAAIHGMKRMNYKKGKKHRK